MVCSTKRFNDRSIDQLYRIRIDSWRKYENRPGSVRNFNLRPPRAKLADDVDINQRSTEGQLQEEEGRGWDR